MTGDYKKSKWVKGGISIVKDGRVSYNADLTKPRGHRGERKQFRAGSTEAAEAFARKLLDRRDLALGLDIEMDSTWQWLFDEATSALDNVSQSLVTETVAELPITRIVVAHRLSTIVAAERVVVLDGGRVVEQGSPAALLDAGQVFARMAARQVLA